MWASSVHGANTNKCEKGELTTKSLLPIDGVCLGHQSPPLWYVLLLSIPRSLSVLVQAFVDLLEPTAMVAVSCVSYERLAKWLTNLGTYVMQIVSPFGNL